MSSHFNTGSRQVSSAHSRYEPSIMSEAEFPLRSVPGSSGRAHDLTASSAAPPLPAAIPATLPYPQLVNTTGISSHTPSPPLTSPSALSHAQRSGLLGALGRKTSKRNVTRGAISNPILVRTPSGSSTLNGPRPLEGIADLPEEPTSSARSVYRSSYTSPLGGPRRNSEKSIGDTIDEAALSGLCDILPQADRETLRRYLLRAGGDQLRAVDMFMAEERRNSLL